VIVETATVLEVRGDVAIVRCHRQAACERCAEGRGCGGGIMARLLGERLDGVRVPTNGMSLTPGDEVAIGLEEQGLVLASLAVYFVPLAGALAGSAAVASLIGGGDPAALAGAGAGFAAGLAWARRFGRRHRGDGRFRPRLLGAAAHPSTAPDPRHL
jgi:sigma-E factor negative regulatory protein RseC